MNRDPFANRGAPRDALGLTKRESDVVRHALRGMTNKQIAATLGVTAPTVKNQLYSAMTTLGVQNRTALAARIAQRAGVDLAGHFDKLRRAA